MGLVLVLIVFNFSGCAKGGVASISDKFTSVKGDIGSDICKEFSADFMYSATGKPIVKIEPDWALPKTACRFYFTYDKNFYKEISNPALRAGGSHIFVALENLNVAKQKQADEFLGVTVKSDPRIKMDNVVAYRENGTIWQIRLIINPDRYVRADYTNKSLTDEEFINVMAKMAEKIQGKVSFDIKTNPTPLQDEPEAVGKSQQAVAESFLQKLSNRDIDGALKMLDMSMDTKQSWGVNFYNIESLKVNKIEEAFTDEWTGSRQVFKVELDAKVKPSGLNMGWVQGKNFRWITLKKNAAGTWMVGEIANNP